MTARDFEYRVDDEITTPYEFEKFQMLNEVLYGESWEQRVTRADGTRVRCAYSPQHVMVRFARKDA